VKIVAQEDATAMAPADDSSKKGVEFLNGGAIRLWTAQPELGAWLFNEYLQGALENGSAVPSPPAQIVEGGIGAMQEALDLLKKGVSGRKLVLKVE
jgi:hypothetical protein